MVPDPLFAVRDRVIVVTGGGGKLGGQFARALLARGAKVAVFDAADAAMVRGRYPDQDDTTPLRCFQVDVTSSHLWSAFGSAPHHQGVVVPARQPNSHCSSVGTI